MPQTKSSVIIPSTRQLQEFFTRGVSTVVPESELEAGLRSGLRLRVYLGVDPTGPHIHLGHAVLLRKLAQLQAWGHEVILLLGDFTAQIGDPTGKDQARSVLTIDEIRQNAATYKQQAATILDFDHPTNPVRLEYNATWLSKLSFQDVIELSAHFTVQQMLERDMFEKRLADGKPIHLHEFLYPVMQGYDSVAMDVDLEVGGNDQLFNMLAGRTLQHVINQKNKSVLTAQLLPGTDGRKMSKSYNNVIGVTDSPVEMFGKLMALRDELINDYAVLCTDWTMEQVGVVAERLRSGENPRDVKVDVAKAIVALYHDTAAAEDAAKEFFAVFADKGKPTEIPEYTITDTDTDLITLMIHAQLVDSKGQARRLVEQGGVKLDDEKITDPTAQPDWKAGSILQVGKRRFVKIV